MKIINKTVSLKKLWDECESGMIDMIKIVVDIKQEIIAADAEMHADLEEILLENGSQQQDLWGANIYPENNGEEMLEYTSFINIRPGQNNRSMEIENPEIRTKVRSIVQKLIVK